MDKTHRYGVKLKKSSVNSFYRGVAYLIDWYVATMFAGIPIVLIGSIVNHTTSVSQDLSKIPAPYNILVALLAIVFYLGYFVILELYVYKGQTFGKRIMKLKVVKNDESDVDFKTILMREGLGIMIVEGYIANSSSYLRQLIQIVTGIPIMDMAVYVFGIISAVSILMGMASPSRKMIHDRIANTHIMSDFYTIINCWFNLLVDCKLPNSRMGCCSIISTWCRLDRLVQGGISCII